MPPELMVPFLALAAIGIIVGGWWLAIYNRLARLRQHLRESWADIDVQLKRRHDLIPNLVSTVRGYAAHESELLTKITELRNVAAAEQRPRVLGERETSLQRQVGTLLVRAEAHPDLKADQHFLKLQRELALTEDRIAAARRFYNGNVRDLNSLVTQFPSRLVANAGGFTTADYFEVADDAERVAGRVQF